jgi:hypothetical protein
MNETELLDIFEDTFRLRISGCRATCHCGKTFYNGSGGWDWEDGEIEALEKAGATPVDHGVGYVQFENCDYVDACSCWHARAKMVIAFITTHDEQIADFLNKRRERTIAKAAKVAAVKP